MNAAPAPRERIPANDEFPGADAVRSLFDLHGRIALVTGAASGLGKQIALGFASFGADVAVADINAEGAAKTAAGIEALGRKTLSLHVDVTKWDEVTAMVDRTQQHFGRIDICVNTPGINIRKPALDMSPDEYGQVLDLNLKGMFYSCKAAGAVMVRQGRGKIINVASIFGVCGGPTQAAYASSKGGIVQLTKVLALEWAAHDVQVNTLAPGYHMTIGPIARQYLETPEGKVMQERILEKIPQGRIAHAGEIIGPAVFLASDASNYLTGALLVPDGGWTAQ